MEKKVKIKLILVVLGVLLLGLSIVYADPSTPGISRLADSTFNESQYGAQSLAAEAGNVTLVSINGVSQTKSWQGYWGNVTGTITLDDAQNYTMYSWTSAEPQGEVFAANGTVSNWLTIHCFNFSTDFPGVNCSWSNDRVSNEMNNSNNVCLNLTTLESDFGINTTDIDGVNETFNVSGGVSDGTLHVTFDVGLVTIAEGECPAVDLYENDLQQENTFQEVMMTVNNSADIIFVSILENRSQSARSSIIGFNNQLMDFQMLVLDNGHSGSLDDVTTYYFYVELE
jgi:hypothetical protein